MAANVGPMDILVTLSGDGQVKAKLAGIAQSGKASTDKLATGTTHLSRWKSALGGVGSAFSGILGQASRLTGLLGVGFGAAGFVKLVGDFANYETAFTSATLTMRLSSEQAAAFDAGMKRLATTIGLTKSELVGLTRSGVDFGLTMEQSMAAVEGAWGLAQMWGVEANEIMKMLGPLTAGGLDPMQALGWLRETQAQSNMSEAAFVAMITPAIKASEGDFQMLATVTAGVGGTGFKTGRESTSAMLELIEMLAGRGGAEGETIRKRAGITGEEAPALALKKAVEIATAGGLNDLDGQVAKVLREMDNLEAQNAASTRSLADYTAAGEKVQEESRIMQATAGVRWAVMIEEMKAAFEPLATGFLAWFKDNSDEIVESFKDLGLAVVELVRIISKIPGFVKQGARGVHQFIEDISGGGSVRSGGPDRPKSAEVLAAEREWEEAEAARVAAGGAPREMPPGLGLPDPYSLGMLVARRAMGAGGWGAESPLSEEDKAWERSRRIPDRPPVTVNISVAPSLGATVQAASEGNAIVTAET